MADFSASEKDLETLFGKYPQVGVFKGKRRPYDALWLPSGWESAAYPRGTNESDNARAILKWLSFQIERLLGQTRQSREFLERYPEEAEACGYEETPVVADAYSLVAWLQERNGWPDPPPEPDRQYTRLPDDLNAAVKELRSVQRWVVTWFGTAEKQKGGGQRDDSGSEAVHSADFRSVRWFGTEYAFTPTQAACIRVLWENWAKGTPEVGEQTILEDERVNSAQNRLSHVFDKGNHPAWGTMIVPGRIKGAFRLAEPEQ